MAEGGGVSNEFRIVAPFLAIDSEDDIRRFFAALHVANIGFHPEETFHEIGHRADSGEWVRTFTDGEAEILDKAMERAYEITRPLMDADENPDHWNRYPLRGGGMGRTYNGPHDPCFFSVELMEAPEEFVEAWYEGADHWHIGALVQMVLLRENLDDAELADAMATVVAGGISAHYEEPDMEQAHDVLAEWARSEREEYPLREDGMG